jgi:hypothetical protein
MKKLREPSFSGDESHLAFRALVRQIAVDADAALGFASAYGEMSDEARDAQIAVLEHEAKSLRLPREGLFAPLLAVENDPKRRARLVAALRGQSNLRDGTVRAFYTQETPARIVLLSVAYLDFATGVVAEVAPLRATRIPLMRVDQASAVLGCGLVPCALDEAVDHLAHAVVAHRDSLEEAACLMPYLELFAPRPEALQEVS